MKMWDSRVLTLIGTSVLNEGKHDTYRFKPTFSTLLFQYYKATKMSSVYMNINNLAISSKTIRL